MKCKAGNWKNLYITRNTPRSISSSRTPWASVAGKRIAVVWNLDPKDNAYEVFLAGITGTIWIPEDWIELVEDPTALHRAWCNEQLTESQRQTEYAAAFQRLMWRELLGKAAKKSVGAKATIKGCARTIERAFPDAWREDWYSMCWGRSGTVSEETREMGKDGELHRGYRIKVFLPESTGFESMQLWWLGEDLEAK